MAVYRDCPECGRTEAVKIELMDGDLSVGVGDYPEITETDCGCIIGADNAERMLAEFDSWDLNDWYPH